MPGHHAGHRFVPPKSSAASSCGKGRAGSSGEQCGTRSGQPKRQCLHAPRTACQRCVPGLAQPSAREGITGNGLAIHCGGAPMTAVRSCRRSGDVLMRSETLAANPGQSNPAKGMASVFVANPALDRALWQRRTSAARDRGLARRGKRNCPHPIPSRTQ